MNDSSPPGYSSSSPNDTAPQVLLNLAPPPDSTTFQLGYLGHGPAFIAGDVQIKYAGSDADPRPSFSALELSFRGIERIEGSDAIELSEQRKVLWGLGAAGSSSTPAEDDFPPNTLPFKLELTPDLPMCLHLGSSALDYTLTAALHYSDPRIPPLVRSTPVHLARTSPPGSLLADTTLAALSNPPASTAPVTISAHDPLDFSVRLPRTVFRRSEPIELVARIEVPSAKAVGEGLRLRTVSAELVRTITVKPVAEPPSRQRRLSGNADETEGIPSAPRAQEHTHRTVLAHSGKSARFSPSRPIVIRLVLHPPGDPACESITQATILHSVTFSVVVTVGLFVLGSSASASTSTSTSTSTPTSLDATLSQAVFVVPDTTSSRSNKQKEAEREASPSTSAADAAPRRSSAPWMALDLDGPVPTYVEYGADDPGIPAASGSGSVWTSPAAAVEDLRRSWETERFTTSAGEGEEEYDGYEELSLVPESASPPPPGIYEDVSPPSPSEQQGFSIESALAHAAQLEPMTPPPNDFALEDEPDHLSHSRLTETDAPPPPHVEFPPLHLPSTPTTTTHSAPSSPPPPVSPLDGEFPRSSSSLPPPPHGAEGSPPPYIGVSPSLPPPSLSARTIPYHPHSPRSSELLDHERRYRPSYQPRMLSRSGSPGSSSSSASSDETSVEHTGSGEEAGPLEAGPGGGAGEREVEAEEGEEDEEPTTHDPPPYESREEDDRVELVRFGVTRRGELVL
ncbi:hypothetical protein JCM1840_000045 [Sporobolomyces johnsonii]